MVADKGKKLKLSEKGEEENSDHIDGDLVLSIEKLQEIQDELEKVISFFFCLFFSSASRGKRDKILFALMVSVSFTSMRSYAGFKILNFFSTCIFVGTKLLVPMFIYLVL